MRRWSLGFLLCGSVTLSAATLTVTTSGTYSPTTPTSSWTAPNATWSLSFNVDSNPMVSNSTAGVDFDAPVTNFVYKLNGTTVNVGTVDVAFFSTAESGLINIGVLGSAANTTALPTNGIELFGPQAYSGTEAAPTILPNTYAETLNTLVVAGTPSPQALGTVTITAAAPPGVPAPPSSILALFGLAAVGIFFGVSRRRVRA